ncbi:MAG: hypothetical protein KVP17_001042 [Porospora cf. gigantea B]|uniref:uncharacterized protein n=1 Tax=Porospora cf. gigantea B TaxID=2853592 RepID=UPI0035719708|nr:MAG: hypothetical protein KVP17_001042 [Porospora cf. gigantea B]
MEVQQLNAILRSRDQLKSQKKESDTRSPTLEVWYQTLGKFPDAFEREIQAIRALRQPGMPATARLVRATKRVWQQLLAPISNVVLPNNPTKAMVFTARARLEREQVLALTLLKELQYSQLEVLRRLHSRQTLPRDPPGTVKLLDQLAEEKAELLATLQLKSQALHEAEEDQLRWREKLSVASELLENSCREADCLRNENQQLRVESAKDVDLAAENQALREAVELLTRRLDEVAERRVPLAASNFAIHIEPQPGTYSAGREVAVSLLEEPCEEPQGVGGATEAALAEEEPRAAPVKSARDGVVQASAEVRHTSTFTASRTVERLTSTTGVVSTQDREAGCGPDTRRQHVQTEVAVAEKSTNLERPSLTVCPGLSVSMIRHTADAMVGTASVRLSAVRAVSEAVMARYPTLSLTGCPPVAVPPGEWKDQATSTTPMRIPELNVWRLREVFIEAEVTSSSPQSSLQKSLPEPKPQKSQSQESHSQQPEPDLQQSQSQQPESELQESRSEQPEPELQKPQPQQPEPELQKSQSEGDSSPPTNLKHRADLSVSLSTPEDTDLTELHGTPVDSPAERSLSSFEVEVERVMQAVNAPPQVEESFDVRTELLHIREEVLAVRREAYSTKVLESLSKMGQDLLKAQQRSSDLEHEAKNIRDDLEGDLRQLTADMRRVEQSALRESQQIKSALASLVDRVVASDAQESEMRSITEEIQALKTQVAEASERAASRMVELEASFQQLPPALRAQVETIRQSTALDLDRIISPNAAAIARLEREIRTLQASRHATTIPTLWSVQRPR